jgi:hypothetical protein
MKGGQNTVRVYSTCPTGLSLPCRVFSHGGGLLAGHAGPVGLVIQGPRQTEVACLVVSVLEYRMAPLDSDTYFQPSETLQNE